MNGKKKIAVNTRFLLPKLEGIGTYTHQVMQRVVKLMPEIEFHFLFDRDWDKKYIYTDNIIPHKLPPQARHPLLWYWWFEMSVNNWLRQHKMDLFFSPDSFLSFKNRTPSLLVMHDIAYEHFPGHLSWLVRTYYQSFFPIYAKKANKILAVSEFTKQDIIKHYKIEANKIEIAPCAASEIYQPITDEQKTTIRGKYSKSKPYFISVGSINPRKNMLRIAQAFDLYKSEQQTDEKLLIVGAKGWKTNKFYDTIANLKWKDDIIFTGHLTPTDLHKVLATAEALIFPSLYEGFGIPIIEAMQSGVPVVTSNISSMPEVAGDVAVLVDPNDTQDIKNAFVEIKNKGAQLIKKGFLQAEKYSWDKTAEIVASQIEQLLKVSK